MNSKRKGKEGELELAKVLRSQGFTEARRSQQYAGINHDADIVGIDGLHIECKRAEAVRDESYLRQAERDSDAGDVPVVMYRRNNEQWKVLLRQDLFMAIWSELNDMQKGNIRLKVKFIEQAGTRH